MKRQSFSLAPLGMEYPVLIRDLDGFDPLSDDSLSGIGNDNCKIYTDPNLQVTDTKIGLETTFNDGFLEAMRLSSVAASDLPKRIDFPVIGLKTQDLKHGGAIIGLVTDENTQTMIDSERRRAATIFGMRCTSSFDMLPICTIELGQDKEEIKKAFLDYITANESNGFFLSRPTIKILTKLPKLA